jgi:hypothetical protein
VIAQKVDEDLFYDSLNNIAREFNRRFNSGQYSLNFQDKVFEETLITIKDHNHFMGELKVVQLHLESLYSAHVEGFHKKLDSKGINAIFNIVASGYRATIPSINLAT